MYKHLTFSLTPETEEQIKYLAKKNYRSKSMIVRMAIAQLFAKEKSKKIEELEESRMI